MGAAVGHHRTSQSFVIPISLNSSDGNDIEPSSNSVQKSSSTKSGGGGKGGGGGSGSNNTTPATQLGFTVDGCRNGRRELARLENRGGDGPPGQNLVTMRSPEELRRMRFLMKKIQYQQDMKGLSGGGGGNNQKSRKAAASMELEDDDQDVGDVFGGGGRGSVNFKQAFKQFLWGGGDDNQQMSMSSQLSMSKSMSNMNSMTMSKSMSMTKMNSSMSNMMSQAQGPIRKTMIQKSKSQTADLNYASPGAQIAVSAKSLDQTSDPNSGTGATRIDNIDASVDDMRPRLLTVQFEVKLPNEGGGGGGRGKDSHSSDVYVLQKPDYFRWPDQNTLYRSEQQYKTGYLRGGRQKDVNSSQQPGGPQKEIQNITGIGMSNGNNQYDDNVHDNQQFYAMDLNYHNQQGQYSGAGTSSSFDYDITASHRGRFYSMKYRVVGSWKIENNVLSLRHDGRGSSADNTHTLWCRFREDTFDNTYTKAKAVCLTEEARPYLPLWLRPTYISKKLEWSDTSQENFECQVCYFPLHRAPVSCMRRHSSRVCKHYIHTECGQRLLDIAIRDKNRSHSCCLLCGAAFNTLQTLPDLCRDPRSWFQCVDVDKSGSLSRDEVIEGLGAIYPFTRQDLGKTLQDNWWEWDKNNDGTISLRELVMVKPRGLKEFIKEYNLMCLQYERDYKNASGDSGQNNSSQKNSKLNKLLDGNIPDLDSHPRHWFEYWDADNSGTLEPHELSRALIRTIAVNVHTGEPCLSRAHTVRELAMNLWLDCGYHPWDSIDFDTFMQPGGIGDTFMHNLVHGNEVSDGVSSWVNR